ncbi:hypothetical protein C8Q73DRAFT_750108 [Cubamyces lactineus]|nr:hypothetical protein C8Q73DRAFT_750108 [Cubamyces lactineus]
MQDKRDKESVKARATSHPLMAQTRSDITNTASAPKLKIAISGGGIAGLTLAATLCRYVLDRDELEINIYEADPEVRTAGAGITIWPRTWTVMRHLGLYDAMSKLAVKGEKVDQDERKPAFVARKADQPEEGFNYCYVLAPSGSTTMHRRDMIDVFLSNLPPSCKLHTSKRLTGYSRLDATTDRERELDAPLQLSFADGSTARADILIGADGIHSATRYAMYADAHAAECLRAGVPSNETERWQDCERCKAAQPVWSGVHSYRFLIPTEELYTLNSNHTTRGIGSVLCYSGKDKQVITYQISGGKYLNFVALCREPDGDGARYEGKWVTEAPREELLSRFTYWEPEVQQMLQCVQQPTRWAIHVVENLPFAVRGNIALVGDALHAMTPNFGAGGGQAIEDAYILGRLLADPRVTRAHVPAPSILRIYERVRLPFTTDIARRAREVGLMYEFNAPGYFSGAAATTQTGLNPDRAGKVPGNVREELEELGRAIHEMWEWQWTLEFDEQWEAAAKELEEVFRQDPAGPARAG